MGKVSRTVDAKQLGAKSKEEHLKKNVSGAAVRWTECPSSFFLQTLALPALLLLWENSIDVAKQNLRT